MRATPCIGWWNGHKWERWFKGKGLKLYDERTKRFERTDSQERFCSRCGIHEIRATVDMVVH